MKMMKPSTTSWSPSLKEGGYVKPELEVLNLLNSDIITNSGTETTQVESNDGVWDLNQSI